MMRYFKNTRITAVDESGPRDGDIFRVNSSKDGKTENFNYSDHIGIQ